MKYSIIIAVYNRLNEVEELLESAENLDFKRADFEILFVDDGSNDGFKEFISSYNSESDLQIRTIFQKNKGPGAARNFGMKNAIGEYFIFVDSDCMFPQHWLKEIDTSIKNNKWDAFGGPDTYHPSFSPLQKAINYSMTSFIGTGGTRGKELRVGIFYPRSFNMGIHRDIYEKIGGMGKLRFGQDMDYSLKIYNSGYKVGLISKAFVYHKRRTNLKKFFKQIFNWGFTRIKLTNKYPSMLKIFHLFPGILLLGLFSLFIISFFLQEQIIKILWATISFIVILIIIWTFIESYFKYRNFKAAFLSPIALFIQIFAYGIGLIVGFWDVIILRKKYPI